MAGIPGFQNPNIDAITMTYGYMRNYEDRVRRAVNTPRITSYNVCYTKLLRRANRSR